MTRDLTKIKNWKTLSTEELAKFGYFRLRSDRCELPDGRIMPRYFTIEFSDWVNVIPVTKEKKIVLIHQYRHSVGELTIEVPGGSTNPKQKEDNQAAAIRELEEETGYTAKSMEYVGFHHPNPALISNKMHTYIAWDCEKTKPLKLDPYEDIESFEVSVTELEDLIDKGKITHSIILASFLLARKKLQL